MLVHYGYQDGSGDWFISIDTGRCGECVTKACVAACPVGVLEIVEDDYGDEVAAVTEAHRKKIKYSCAPCQAGPGPPPCQAACSGGAIRHSW